MECKVVELSPDGGRSAKRARYVVKLVEAGDVVRYQWSSLRDTFDRSKVNDRSLFAYRRAMRTLKDRVLALRADRMLTLTYHDNMQDILQARRDLLSFFRVVRRKYSKIKFVAVSELQQRGAVHWHIALNGWVDVVFLRAAWCRVTSPENVFVNMKYFRGQSALAIAEYISKYLGKGFGEEPDDKPRYLHYYHVARGLAPEVLRVIVYGADQGTFEEWLCRDKYQRDLYTLFRSVAWPYSETGCHLTIRRSSAPQVPPPERHAAREHLL